MANAAVPAAGVETRQSMLRVWMAMSAVWIAFWLAIAAIVVASGAARFPLAGQFAPFAAIVLAPPLIFLGFGVTIRWAFEMALRRPSMPWRR